MNKKPSPSAKREYCIWADYVRRVYQYVEADSPHSAYEIAKAIGAWEPCDIHDHNVYRLSDEVQDLEAEEFVAVHGASHCRTCGSEIVATINDSVFRQGECDACERARYESQPALLDAAGLALDEIEQWHEVMGGSEDPRTAEAIAALQAAIVKAQHLCSGFGNDRREGAVETTSPKR
jgi:hypothetical protein